MIDTLIFKPEHTRKARKIMKATISGDIKTITIGGESGTGKSEVAHKLVDLFWKEEGVRAKVIQLDDFYLTHPIERDRLRRKVGMSSVGIHEINWLLLNKIVRCYLDLHAVDKVILEGLYANNFCNKHFSVHILGTIADTAEFRGRRKKEKPTKLRMRVLRKESSEVGKTVSNVDLFV